MIAFLLLSTAIAAPDITEVWVQTRSHEERQVLYSLGLGFAESTDGTWLLMNADPSGLSALHASGLNHRPSTRKSFHDSGHLEPDEMVDELRELASNHPSSATLVHLGWSVQDRPVYALRVSHTAIPSRSIRILAAHHGDETSSAAVAIETVRNLLDSASPVLDAWLDNNEVWVVPHVNPDGIAALNRYNANDVDLNRNYGFMWSAEEFRSGDFPFSEPETRNIRTLGAWVPAGLGLSLHSGATNLGWVWNYTEDRTPHNTLLEEIASSYADHCETDGFWITNGAAWYVTNGDTTDWSYGRYGTLDYTLEVSNHKHPGRTRMDAVVSEHIEAIEQVILWPSWISGQIIDETTGHGVPAIITLSDSEQPIVTGPDGRFSRPTSEDAIDAFIESPGFQSHDVRLEPREEPFEIQVQRSTVSPTKPTAPSLPASGVFTLDGEASSVVLSRPGHEPHAAERAGSNEWRVDPSQLHPGPWDLVIDGSAAPRSLFVRELDDRVAISDHWEEDGKLFLALTEVHEGVHAWALYDDYRLLLPLPTEAIDERTLAFDTEAWDESRFDIVLWASGRQILFDGTDEEPSEDTGEDAGDEPTEESTEDTGTTSERSTEPEERVESSTTTAITGGKLRTHNGCNTAGSYPAFYWLVSLLGLMRMRRVPCDISGP